MTIVTWINHSICNCRIKICILWVWTTFYIINTCSFTFFAALRNRCLSTLTNFTTTFTIQRFSTYVFRDVRIAPFKMEISPIVFKCYCKTWFGVRFLAHREFVDVSHRLHLISLKKCGNVESLSNLKSNHILQWHSKTIGETSILKGAILTSRKT